MIFLGLGSNLGDKKQNLETALRLLSAKGVEIVRVSTIIETPPWGLSEQDNFLNLVAEVAFDGSPQALLSLILGIEKEMGRVRTTKWGPRIIDIDMIDFHRIRIHSELLTLPHPFYADRDFVMIPLRELEPQWEVE